MSLLGWDSCSAAVIVQW